MLLEAQTRVRAVKRGLVQILDFRREGKIEPDGRN